MDAVAVLAAPERELEGAELVAWLESPEGENWSSKRHMRADRHSIGTFGEVKEDHGRECPGDGSDIETVSRYGLEIQAEIARYGLSGLPRYAVFG